MNRILLFAFCFTQKFFALDFSKELPLEIDGSNIYKIFVEEATTAFAKLEIFADNQPGEYIIEVVNSSGIFSSGWNEIAYDLFKTPMFDMKNQRYFVYFNENELSKQLQLVFTLPSKVLLPPGTYTTEIPIKILKGKDIISEKNVTAYFNVDEQVTAKLIIDGIEQKKGAALIQFGNVNGEMEKDFSYYVKANTAVKVTISSKNKGCLILDEENGDQTSFIPYTIERNGEIVNLNHDNISTTAENSNNPISNVKVLLHPDMKKTFCGKYRDRISITISSL